MMISLRDWEHKSTYNENEGFNFRYTVLNWNLEHHDIYFEHSQVCRIVVRRENWTRNIFLGAMEVNTSPKESIKSEIGINWLGYNSEVYGHISDRQKMKILDGKIEKPEI